MRKALPLKLWLELEDSVNRHKAEVAQNFAQARARLLAPKPVDPWEELLDRLDREQGREPTREWRTHITSGGSRLSVR